MPVCSDSPALVTFRGGFVAHWEIVQRLLDLESHDCTFSLVSHGRFRVAPPDRLTADDSAFLRAHRNEARRVIEYVERLAELPV